MTKAKRDTKTDTDALNEALEETFPASDAVSIRVDDKGLSARVDRQPAPLDQALVEKLAREVLKRQSKITHH